jgi:phage terminase large subunit-like protein
LSRSCLRTKTADNEALSAGDPAYADRLRGAGVVLHRQLARDDWDAEEEGGDLFRRAWFPIVSSVPRLDGVLRRWDLAYTAPDSAAARRKRDWTVGIKVGWTTGSGAERCFYVLNLVRTQGKPAEVRALIQQTAQVDGAIPVYVPVDYAAGAWVLSNVREALPQHDVREAKERGAKDVRIRGLQQHVGPPAEGGEPVCRVLLAPADGADWVEGFLDEAAAYPNGRWDDQLDALAGAVIASLEVGPSAEDIERDVKQAGAVARALGGGDEEFGWSWDEPLRVL